MAVLAGKFIGAVAARSNNFWNGAETLFACRTALFSADS